MGNTDRWAERDVLAADARKEAYPILEVSHGMTLTHTASNTTGTVAGFNERDRVMLIDRYGTKQVFRALDGAFKHEGTRVALRSPAVGARKPRFTASGSVRAEDVRAQVARGGRIWVEGIHDAELIEKVWGDDLRATAVVVEPLHGADDLAGAVAEFDPSADRPLGILLDHLVEGTKESRIASTVAGPHVLVSGHPYVDIWEAIDPSVVGLRNWPQIPIGTDWKTGVLEALGFDGSSGEFWGRTLDAVSSFRDLATPLVNSVERLIDFVTTVEP
jgi:hypothetical protein